MRDLERRIAELERKAGGENMISVIVRSFYAPGAKGPQRCEPRAYVCAATGWRLDREPGEEAEAFERRAIVLVPREPGAFTVLRQVLA